MSTASGQEREMHIEYYVQASAQFSITPVRLYLLNRLKLLQYMCVCLCIHVLCKIQSPNASFHKHIALRAISFVQDDKHAFLNLHYIGSLATNQILFHNLPTSQLILYLSSS